MDTNTTIKLMAFEGGGLIQELSSKTQCATLATKIANADQSALDAGQVHFSISLDPIEVGMALSAASGSQSPLAQAVADKLKRALSNKLQELGIQYPEPDEETPEATPPATDGDEPQPASSDTPATDAEPVNDEPGDDDGVL